jgi:hypothetical protein
MAAVRAMASGSSSDVPPNFMTTRLMRDFPCCEKARLKRRRNVKMESWGISPQGNSIATI